jgi:hypothetical protein
MGRRRMHTELWSENLVDPCLDGKGVLERKLENQGVTPWTGVIGPETEAGYGLM